MSNMKEIERQFALERDISPTDIEELVNAGHNLSARRFDEEQYSSYLYTEPVQVRIRKVCKDGHNYHYLTIKGQYEKLTTRTEIEVPITKEYYDAISSLIGKEPIRKVCMVINVDGTDIVVSTVDPFTPTSFVFAEAEFSSEEEAAKFEWPFPNVGAVEVTGRQCVNPGKSMSMTDYWSRYRLGQGGPTNTVSEYWLDHIYRGIIDRQFEWHLRNDCIYIGAKDLVAYLKRVLHRPDLRISTVAEELQKQGIAVHDSNGNVYRRYRGIRCFAIAPSISRTGRSEDTTFII